MLSTTHTDCQARVVRIAVWVREVYEDLKKRRPKSEKAFTYIDS